MRERGGGGGVIATLGDGIQNKCNLPIPFTPHEVYSEHATSCYETQGEYREREMETCRKRARFCSS